MASPKRSSRGGVASWGLLALLAMLARLALAGVRGLAGARYMASCGLGLLGGVPDRMGQGLDPVAVPPQSSRGAVTSSESRRGKDRVWSEGQLLMGWVPSEQGTAGSQRWRMGAWTE